MKLPSEIDFEPCPGGCAWVSIGPRWRTLVQRSGKTERIQNDHARCARCGIRQKDLRYFRGRRAV